MIGKFEIATTLTILLFGLPVLYFIFKNKVFSLFSFRLLMKSFNLALIIQIIIAFVLALTMLYLDKNIYGKGLGNDFTEILVDAGLIYLVIGAFFYLPSILILNVLNFARVKLKKK